MQACCSGESGGNERRSHAGTCCADRSSSIVAMSFEGSRCSVFRPDRARSRRCRIPSLWPAVNARYVPRCAAGTVSSPIEKSRTCSS